MNYRILRIDETERERSQWTPQHRNSGGIVSVVAVASVQHSLYVLSVPSRLEVKTGPLGEHARLHQFLLRWISDRSAAQPVETGKLPNLRILIADDHEIVRQGLRSLVESHAGWEVCGEAADGWDSVHKTRALNPDVVALDIGMPNLNGLDAAREILSENPRAKILFLTIYDTEQAVKTAIQVGAKGLILKSDAARELVTAVEAIQRNATYFSSQTSQAVLRPD